VQNKQAGAAFGLPFFVEGYVRIQDQLRAVLLRGISRGTLSVSLLARKTGLGQPQVSNFIRGRRNVSMGSFDKLLRAANFAAQLFPSDKAKEP